MLDIDLISEPPTPPPPKFMYPKCGNLCGQRGTKWFIASWVSGCQLFVPAPHAPPPKGIGQRLKVVILPTTVQQRLQSVVEMSLLIPLGALEQKLSLHSGKPSPPDSRTEAASPPCWMAAGAGSSLYCVFYVRVTICRYQQGLAQCTWQMDYGWFIHLKAGAF